MICLLSIALSICLRFLTGFTQLTVGLSLDKLRIISISPVYWLDYLLSALWLAVITDCQLCCVLKIWTCMYALKTTSTILASQVAVSSNGNTFFEFSDIVTTWDLGDIDVMVSVNLSSLLRSMHNCQLVGVMWAAQAGLNSREGHVSVLVLPLLEFCLETANHRSFSSNALSNHCSLLPTIWLVHVSLMPPLN